VSEDKTNLPPKPSAEGAEKPSAPETGVTSKTTGRVQFDDRGNAVWEWSLATGAFGREVSTARLQKLEHPALSLADDAPTPMDTVRPNPLGTKTGYNPYDSGKLGKTAVPPRKKTDLRRLSEFIKLKKQASGNKDDE
jgi:hypothetical protein